MSLLQSLNCMLKFSITIFLRKRFQCQWSQHLRVKIIWEEKTKKNLLSRLNDFPFEEKMTFFLLKASFNHILHFDIYWRLRQKIHSRWAKIKSHKWLFWKFWAVMTQLEWVAASFKSYLSPYSCVAIEK